MLKKFFNKDTYINNVPSKSIASAAFLITVAGLASRVLGLFRDRLLASTFGAGDVLDVYDAAFRIPDLIYNILILGALSAAFIPIFTSLISKEKKSEAWELANGIINLSVFFIIIFSLIFFTFAPFFMKLLTPGFPPIKIDMLVMFTRVMAISPLLLGISGILGGMLTSFKRFLIYSIAPLFYNVGIIIGVSVFVRFMGPIGLAWGVVLGAFMHMAVQYMAVKKAGFNHSFSLFNNFKNRNVRRVFKLMIPRTLGIAINQINAFVITIFASTLAAGSIAVMSFAQNLQSVPLGIFGISFSIAAFPTLSAFAAKKEDNNFVKTFSETFRQIIFFVIPASIFILLLRAQLVRVVLGAGKFDWQDTILTFQCLEAFSLSLFAQCLIPLLARSFYALQDTKTPFYIAVISEVVNIGAVVFLIHRFGVVGLAIAFSLSSLVQMLLLLFVLRTRFEDLDDNVIIRSTSKIAIASFLAGIIIQVCKYVVARYVDMDTFLGVFAQLSISGGLGAAVFILASHLMKIEEFIYFKNSFSKKIFRGKKVIIEDTGDVSGIN